MSSLLSTAQLRQLEEAAKGMTPAEIRGALGSAGVDPALGLAGVPPSQIGVVCTHLQITVQSGWLSSEAPKVDTTGMSPRERFHAAEAALADASKRGYRAWEKALAEEVRAREAWLASRPIQSDIDAMNRLAEASNSGRPTYG